MMGKKYPSLVKFYFCAAFDEAYKMFLPKVAFRQIWILFV